MLHWVRIWVYWCADNFVDYTYVLKVYFGFGKVPLRGKNSQMLFFKASSFMAHSWINMPWDNESTRQVSPLTSNRVWVVCFAPECCLSSCHINTNMRTVWYWNVRINIFPFQFLAHQLCSVLSDSHSLYCSDPYCSQLNARDEHVFF